MSGRCSIPPILQKFFSYDNHSSHGYSSLANITPTRWYVHPKSPTVVGFPPSASRKLIAKVLSRKFRILGSLFPDPSKKLLQQNPGKAERGTREQMRICSNSREICQRPVKAPDDRNRPLTNQPPSVRSKLSRISRSMVLRYSQREPDRVRVVNFEEDPDKVSGDRRN